MTVSAHFDGRVIVPDEPLDLPPNQALIVQIERVGDEAVPSDESALTWIAANAVDSEALPTDLADRHDHYLYGSTSSNDPSSSGRQAQFDWTFSVGERETVSGTRESRLV